jgi:excisionase family DNA binding protein
MSQMEPLMTAKEVALLLAVPESWVREATRDGRLPHLVLGRYRRYQHTAIEAWLKDQAGGPTGRRADLRSRRS